MKIGIDLGGSHIGVGVIDNKNFIIEKVEKRLLNKDKKDIKISFCGYNKNTTVGEIRKDFENLETAKSKVNEYRKTKYQNANEEKIDKSTSRITVWDFAR